MILNEFERLIRRDPARRGLIGAEDSLDPLCPGHLAKAATDLSTNGRRVVIVTGFFIPGATPPAAETDGPPGAAVLAAALIQAGMSVQIVTDHACGHAVSVAAQEMNLDPAIVITFSNDPDQIDEWCRQQVRDAARSGWSHLISIERVGPSHTSASIRAQATSAWIHSQPTTTAVCSLNPEASAATRAFDQESSAAAILTEFEHLVPAGEQGRCYNMRGESLDDHTAPLHRLFEFAQEVGSIKTIGIGDGGNEIGMGAIPWRELRRRLKSDLSARIPCRIKTDWTIIAGVSNWGGMALGAATLCLKDRAHLLAPWTSDQQRRMLERLVRDGPAVDGITRLREPTVDGLPFLTYIQPWEGIRRIAGVT